MYYNINEKEFMDFIDQYEDKLEEVANFYNEFDEKTDEVLLYFNQELKKFPIINSWRIEICYLWDQCRLSLVSALAANKMLKQYDEVEISNEKVHTTFKAEYFLENVTYRLFSILEKVAHLINELMNLGLKERKVSFYTVQNIIQEEHQDSVLNGIIYKFNYSDAYNQKVKDFRNALTHRKDPFQPHYELRDSETIVHNKESELFGEKIRFNSPEQIAPKFEFDSMLDTVMKFYENLTEFLDEVMFHSLNLLIKKYENESSYYGEFDK